MPRRLLAPALLSRRCGVKTGHAGEQRGIAGAFANQLFRETGQVHTQPPDAPDGQIFINQPLPVVQIAQVTERAAALVDVVVEMRLGTDRERRVAVEHIAQQACATARRTYDKDRRFTSHTV